MNNLNTAEDLSSTIDLFSKPKNTDINTFFKCHPIQPFNNILFNPLIAYHRNVGSESHKREWLTYNIEKKMFYCSFCIVFTKEINRFVLGCDSSISNNPYERIKEHEKSVNHYQCTEAFLMHSQAKDILSRFTERKRIEVHRKRSILDRIIECIKFIGKRGLSFRGAKNAESAYTLGDQNLDHGNFLEALLLVAKFDPVLKAHIDEVVIKSSKHHERNSGVGRPGNFVTLLSKTTADYIIESIGKLIKTHIVKDLQKAQFFTVQIDSTQDVNIHDQLSVIVRYVTDKVNERLIAVVNNTSGTGKNLCDTVCKVMTDLGIDMKKCIGSSTDGASNMQGQYNGFKAWMEKEAPGQVHVWCYAHVLNLVMIDTTKVSVQSISLFGLLNSCAVFIRESYLRMAKWEETSKYKTISIIGETRWWAKDRSLTKVFGVFFKPDCALFVDLIETFDHIYNNNNFQSDIRFRAKTLLDNLLKYETIITAQIYLRIFSSTTSLSLYLQTQGMNMIQAYKMVETTITTLQSESRDFETILESTKTFVMWVNFQLETRGLDYSIEETFTANRRKNKTNTINSDHFQEHEFNKPVDSFKVHVFLCYI